MVWYTVFRMFWFCYAWNSSDVSGNQGTETPVSYQITSPSDYKILWTRLILKCKYCNILKFKLLNRGLFLK